MEREPETQKVDQDQPGQERVIQVDYRPHLGQQAVHRSRARFRVAANGTRWGKDVMAEAEVIDVATALSRDRMSSSLVPRVHIWAVAPNYALADQFWRELLVRMPRQLVNKISASKGDRYIELLNGELIEIKSADDPKALVAVGLDFLVVIEAALLKKDAWELYLRPRLSSPGRWGRALFEGTPKGKNWYWECFLRGQDREAHPDWESFNFPTSLHYREHRGRLVRNTEFGSPFIPAEEIAAAAKDMPDTWFQQEYLAEFVDDAASAFRGLSSCIRGVPQPPQEDHRYVIGWDVAKYHDAYVAVVMDCTARQVVWLDRKVGIEYRKQKERVLDLARRYFGAKIFQDSTGVGDPIYEEMVREGVKIEGFVFTSTSKQQLLEAWILAVERGEIGIPAEYEVLVNEHKAFGYKLSERRTVQYGAPSGCMDDCVTGCALAYRGAAVYGRALGDGKGPTAVESADRPLTAGLWREEF